MKTVSIQLSNSDRPLYIRLAEAIEAMIKNSEINSGDMLPPVRKLAADAGVSISTVVAAYKRLEDRGLVYTKPGSGTYCLPSEHGAELEEEESHPSGLISDAAGFDVRNGSILNLADTTPDPDVFPVEDFKAALNHVLDTEGGKAFTYQEKEGYFGLRQAIARFAEKHLSIKCSPEDILITSGAQQAIDLVAKVLLEIRDIVITENPTYSGAKSLFSSRGARVLGIPMENDGMDMGLLRYNIKRYKPVMVYTMPVYQTPTGRCMSPEKRRELLRLAEEHDFYILEEDAYGELSFDGTRTYPLKSGDISDRVIYVKSFSKIVMPGIRTGFVIAPRSLGNALARAKYMTDISASGLVQRALSHYLDNCAWNEHIAGLLKLYGKRLDLACSLLKRWEEMGAKAEKPGGGLGIWVKLPDRVRDYELFESCLEKGVMIAPGSSFFVNPVRGCENYVRIAYAAADDESIKRGLAVAGDCLRRLINRKSKKVFYV